jgi:pantoate kinase
MRPDLELAGMTTTAHAPGSVTTVFVPQGEASSLGVSFATADGVTATVAPAGETTVVLDGEAATVEPVAGVLDRLDCTARVTLETAVPIGRGFGVSGAATLATALAANEEFGLRMGRGELVEAAHRAEVAAGTGLGDVFVQERGGLVWNAGNGVERVARDDVIAYESYRSIATEEVLADEAALERVRTAGHDALASFGPGLPLADLLDLSWSFAERTGLATEQVTESVETVWDAGGAATMAMIGETVVAAGAPSVLENQTRITPEGASVE